MRLAVVGITGLVGSRILEVLEERKTNISEFYPVASQKSVGSIIRFNGIAYPVMSISDALQKKPDVAIFSAGSEVSKLWAPEFAKNNTFVIDNSSAWRMEKNIRLIVPEVNRQILTREDKIIANPNCSTIQLVVVLAPLHKIYHIKRLVVSTYQSVSGTGMKAVRQMENERQGIIGEKVYPYHIDKNCFPHGGDFLENGYTSEEMKLVNETRKILDDYTIAITSTIVRVPVFAGHSESVNIEFSNPFKVEDVRELLSTSHGITVLDDPKNNIYPTPLLAEGKDDVFAGRIRRDESIENGLNLWVVSDNLRKGAATNTIQIMEYLATMKFI